MVPFCKLPPLSKSGTDYGTILLVHVTDHAANFYLIYHLYIYIYRHRIIYVDFYSDLPTVASSCLDSNKEPSI